MEAEVKQEAFWQYGPAEPASPIVYAVPHAGRTYPETLLTSARVEPHVLVRLEDRLVDQVAEGLRGADARLIVARWPRAMIDLNRDEHEFDPRLIADLPHHVHARETAKVRGGLGLVPTRLAPCGPIWRGTMPFAELHRRITEIHRPYHAAVAEALRAAHRRFGIALLVDLHSMPPLPRSYGRGEQAKIVLGDLFGRSAASRLTALCNDVMRSAGLPTAINAPYPGSYTLERHGAPDRGIHALQVEIDRTLYLDDHMDVCTGSLAHMQRILCRMDGHLQQELLGGQALQAAE